jgi:hypothetical protein
MTSIIWTWIYQVSKLELKFYIVIYQVVSTDEDSPWMKFIQDTKI